MIKYEQWLFEIGEGLLKGYNFKRIHKDDNIIIYKFFFDNNAKDEYHISFIKQYDPMSKSYYHEIAFGDIDDSGEINFTKTTNKGNPLKVVQTVMDVIKDVRKKSKKIRNFGFRAIPVKAQLYKKFIEKQFPVLNYSERHSNNKKFKIINFLIE